MSEEIQFKEILNDGLLGGEMEPIRFTNPDLNDHREKLLEATHNPAKSSAF